LFPYRSNTVQINTYRQMHRTGFTRGWGCCLITVLACYVVYVAGLAILNTPLPPDTQHASP
jgi:hypothetical protein